MKSQQTKISLRGGGLQPSAKILWMRELLEPWEKRWGLFNGREDLPISKESRLRRLGKQMIRKRQRFWRSISQGQGEDVETFQLSSFKTDSLNRQNIEVQGVSL
jgi:hypothetical protein